MSVSKTVVVATDGSSWSRAALSAAIDVAKAWEAKLVIVAVAPAPAVFTTSSTEVLGVPMADKGVVEAYEKVASDAAKEAREAGVVEASAVTLVGYPVDRLLEYLEEMRPDLVVVGSRGLAGPRRLLLGSVSTALALQSHTPVLIARPPPSHREKFPGKQAIAEETAARPPAQG